MALAQAPGFEPKVPVEYHPYQYQNKDWYQAIDDRFSFTKWEPIAEQECAQRFADWQDRLAKEDQQERRAVRRQQQVASKKLKSHRWLYGSEAQP